MVVPFFCVFSTYKLKVLNSPLIPPPSHFPQFFSKFSLSPYLHFLSIPLLSLSLSIFLLISLFLSPCLSHHYMSNTRVPLLSLSLYLSLSLSRDIILCRGEDNKIDKIIQTLTNSVFLPQSKQTQVVKKLYNHEAQASGSQPVSCGTLGCRELMPGMPPFVTIP